MDARGGCAVCGEPRGRALPRPRRAREAAAAQVFPLATARRVVGGRARARPARARARARRASKRSRPRRRRRRPPRRRADEGRTSAASDARESGQRARRAARAAEFVFRELVAAGAPPPRGRRARRSDGRRRPCTHNRGTASEAPSAAGARGRPERQPARRGARRRPPTVSRAERGRRGRARDAGGRDGARASTGGGARDAAIARQRPARRGAPADPRVACVGARFCRIAPGRSPRKRRRRRRRSDAGRPTLRPGAIV